MHEYDFISKTITEANVKSIIEKAGYLSGNYTYQQRVDGDGYLVRGAGKMSITSLENAAKKLGFTKLTISSPLNLSLVVAGDRADYQVNITMSQETVYQLFQGNYYLYGFKAVQTTIPGGAPLVWFMTQNYAMSTVVGWQKQYQAYTSNNIIIPNGEITPIFSASITLGQTLSVGSDGSGQVVTGGPSTAISIMNKSMTKFTCGISEVQNSAVNPLCAFPLYGNSVDVIAPIEKVLLMFSSSLVPTGTVIMQAFASGLLIDLTSDNMRTVSYDFNKGWSWGGSSWAQQVPSNANIIPLLIETSIPSFQRRALVF